MTGVTLTPKRARFVAEYLVDLNATDAARRAGYSSKTAEQQGPRLLGNVGVAAAIVAGKATQIEQAGLSATRTLEELRRIALIDPRRLFDHDGRLRSVTTLSAEEASCIASMEVVSRRPPGGGEPYVVVHKIRLWDKTRALELLAKHFALLVERSEVKMVADVQALSTHALATELSGVLCRLSGDATTNAASCSASPKPC